MSKAVALTATVGLAAAFWVFTIKSMNGMDMGVATHLGPFPSFIFLWVVMMAAMMLPGAAPAALRLAYDNGSARRVLLFVISYLTVWAIFGIPVYIMYRPHGFLAAGFIVITAGIYELTPFKRSFRMCCHEKGRSGLHFGLNCIGSSIGLMLVQFALGIMSITWMTIIALLVFVQKLLPARTVVDVPVAMAMVGLGILVIVTPSVIPGLMPSM